MSYKGSWNRVKDRKAFADNFDAIFRKKEPHTLEELQSFDDRNFHNQRYNEPACPNHESLEDVLTDPESGFSKP